jgi:hypothetical protein
MAKNQNWRLTASKGFHTEFYQNLIKAYNIHTKCIYDPEKGGLQYGSIRLKIELPDDFS